MNNELKVISIHTVQTSNDMGAFAFQNIVSSSSLSIIIMASLSSAAAMETQHVENHEILSKEEVVVMEDRQTRTKTREKEYSMSTNTNIEYKYKYKCIYK
mmetsp:Transcript_12585/g.13485  ORF Transcript_12585/g.13485 Transcript_12585/m.13485 type:complete len:100 (-) Transcript_12585:25-324(-)